MERYEVKRGQWLNGHCEAINADISSCLWDLGYNMGCCLGHIGKSLGIPVESDKHTRLDMDGAIGPRDDVYYPSPATPQWPRGLFRDFASRESEIQEILFGHGIKYLPVVEQPYVLYRTMAFVNDTGGGAGNDNAHVSQIRREECLTALAALGDIELVFVD